MILQALNEYYKRMVENPDIDIAEPGFSSEKVHAEIILDENGNMLQFNDLRIPKGKRLVPREMMVPQAVKRTSGPRANFLWDNTKYVLGADIKDKPEEAKECFQLFRVHQKQIAQQVADVEFRALLLFLEKWNPAKANTLNNWDELAGGNIVFRLDGAREYVHERAQLRDVWIDYRHTSSESTEGFCLVTGNREPIARLHPTIKGVRDAQSSGAALVTFNLDAFCSYGKKQNLNAPVGEDVAFGYTTALKRLLSPNSKQRIQIGDATTVFWAERESPVEGMLGMVLDPKEAEIADNADLRNFLEATRQGKRPERIDPDVKFYILGISPNAARLAVRFWHVCSVGELEDRIGQHFRDLQLQRRFDSEPEYPGIRRILWETYNKKSKTETASPLLAGTLMRCILEGIAYPQALQSAVINRIRADQDINYVRSAILKAILVRKYRIYKQGMEVTMSLDKENKNPAYLLGRLFAALEKAQQEAIPGAKATIRDRFWGAASSTPRIVFPQLLNLKNHHISKINAENQGKAIFFEKLFGEILDDIESKGFPAHFTLDEQGLFSIGYYHQRQDLFKKKEHKD